jgi:hypothetical protein
MMDQLTITFLTASTALIAGIASPIVSINVARRQFKASVVSSNRERWIEALRDAIAEYIAMVTSVALSAHHTNVTDAHIAYADSELTKAAERIVFMRCKILLMINPGKCVHRDLRQSIDAVHHVLVDKKTIDLAQWRGHLEAITVAGHAVLDAEWERVKRGE